MGTVKFLLTYIVLGIASAAIVDERSVVLSEEINDDNAKLFHVPKLPFKLVKPGNDEDSVVVVANFSRGTKRDDSLHSDADKTQLYESKYFVSEAPDGIMAEKKFSVSQFLPSIHKLKLPNVPQLPFMKPKVTTLTKTKLVYKTQYNTIYPSCLHLQNAHIPCKGSLITVIPTEPLTVGGMWRTESQLDETIENSTDIKELRLEEEITTSSIEPTTTIENEVTMSASIADRTVRASIFATIDKDDTFRHPEQGSSSKIATPPLGHFNAAVHRPKLNFHDFLVPKIEYITEQLVVTKTKDYYDKKYTATVVAEHCIPQDLKLPYCKDNTAKPTIFLPIATFTAAGLEELKPLVSPVPHIETASTDNEFKPILQIDDNFAPYYDSDMRAIQNVEATIRRKIIEDLSDLVAKNPHVEKIYGPVSSNEHLQTIPVSAKRNKYGNFVVYPSYWLERALKHKERWLSTSTLRATSNV